MPAREQQGINRQAREQGAPTLSRGRAKDIWVRRTTYPVARQDLICTHDHGHQYCGKPIKRGQQYTRVLAIDQDSKKGQEGARVVLALCQDCHQIPPWKRKVAQ